MLTPPPLPDHPVSPSMELSAFRTRWVPPTAVTLGSLAGYVTWMGAFTLYWPVAGSGWAPPSPEAANTVMPAAVRFARYWDSIRK